MNGVPRRGRRDRTALLGAPLLTLALLTGAAGLTAVTGCAVHVGGGDASRPGERENPGERDDSRADGGRTDTGACDDGSCEVELSAGDELRPRSSFGVERFTVRGIEGGTVDWTALFSGGRVSMSASGAGTPSTSTTSCTNGSCSGRLGKGRGRLQMNGLTVEFTSIGEGSAVAKVSPQT